MNGTPGDVPTAYQRATPRPTHGSLPITLLQGDADSHPESTSFDALLEVISEHDE